MMPVPEQSRPPRNLVKADAVTSDVVTWVWESHDGPEDDDLADGLVEESLEAASAGRGPAGSPGYGLGQIMSEAEAIIRDAQAEADRVINEARLKAQGARQEIYLDALEQARHELAGDPDALAHQHSAGELTRAAHALTAMAEGLAAAQAEHLEQLEQRVLALAFEIAEKVIGEELQLRPDAVVTAIRAALGRFAGGDVTVRLNPADMPVVQGALIELQAERGAAGSIAFEPDASVESGGCLVTGPDGLVDGRPSSKLAQLKRLADA